MSKQARLRTQELRRIQAEAARREARRRRIVAGIGAVLVLGLVAAIVVALVQASRQSGDDAAGPGDVVVPANVRGGVVPVGEDDAPATVSVYYDYLCPACGEFEEVNGDLLVRLVAGGEVRVELRPLSFLDRASDGTRYSTRSADALATVADGAPEAVWAFHRALYAAQPEEGSAGLSDEEIADLAREAGVPDEVAARIGEGRFEGWVAQVTQEALDAGVQQTPTVSVDGDRLPGEVLFSADAFERAVQDAAQDGPG